MQPIQLFKILMFSLALSPFCLQANDSIQHGSFPEYSAPIAVNSQKDYDYIHQHLWLAYRFYADQKADSFTARLKLSCQQSGMAYSYQDFVNANKKFASAKDQDFSASDLLLSLNAKQHDNQCAKYTAAPAQHEETSSASEAAAE